MDQRQVFETNEELLVILENLHAQKQNASFLVDSEGLSRLEGLITAINKKAKNDHTLLTLEGGRQLELRQVVAVNGVFRSDYSEC
jgi:hypothetical protein